MKIIEGTWPADDLRRAFVAGAKWWEFEKSGFTMWNSDIRSAEEEAEERYPGGKVHKDIKDMREGTWKDGGLT